MQRQRRKAAGGITQGADTAAQGLAVPRAGVTESLEDELAAFAELHFPDGEPGSSPVAASAGRRGTSKLQSSKEQEMSMDLGISKQTLQAGEKNFRFGHKDTWDWVMSSGNSRQMHTKRAQSGSKRSHRKALGGTGIKPGSQVDEPGPETEPQEIDHSNPNKSALSIEMSHQESAVESVVSKQEKERTAQSRQLEQYVSLLPGSEEQAEPREKAHLRRVLTSADGLAPVRYSFQRLGIYEVNRMVYEEEDASKLIHTLSADIYTGLWSCCRKAEVSAPGCRSGPHSDHLYLCVRCGAIFDPSSRHAGPHECYYHPGSLNRSKAGGVWWSCCGAVGFKNSVFHSEKGDINGAQNWRWGCKKEFTHQPLSVMDANVDILKFAHCTVGSIRYGKRVGIDEPGDMKLFTDQDWVEDDQDVTCLRMAGITVIAQPLLPVIIGIQLHYENVIDGEMADGDRRVGDPGRIAEFDHLRKIREERFTLEMDEFLVRIEGSNSTRCITDITVCTNKGRRHTFFQAWKEENNEQSLYDLQQDYLKSFTVECEQQERIVGLQYGLGEALYTIGLLTQERLAADYTGSATLVRRCSLCAAFFVLNSDSAKCRFHTGFWTPQRRVRLADASSMPKCTGMCEARSCGRRCSKYEHRTHVMVHSCGDSTCAEKCSMDGCPRRCAFRDHFHGTNDPMAVHSCGKAHPCRQMCVCGKRCKFVAARGEAVHTQHWCGSSSGCSFPCDVEGCKHVCVHPNHHHALEPDCFHLCEYPHPCEQKCSAPGCSGFCTEDRHLPHRHKCDLAKELGCLCVCSMEGCTNRCASKDHFHHDVDGTHNCGLVHYCTEKCSAPGCKATCSRSREEPHEKHECLAGHSMDCAAPCSVKGCRRRCIHKSHFHGLDLVQRVTADGSFWEPRERHLCGGEHRCEGKCEVYGCVLPCIIDKKELGHRCHCGGTVGCRHRCYFAEIGLCNNYCASEEHEHQADLHLCGDSHQCNESCERTEPCLWDGPTRKRQRKVCTKRIPEGRTKHEGPHDCQGKHARPIAYSYTDEPERCMQRCEKRGCRRRCRFPDEDFAHDTWAEAEPVHMCDQALCLDVCPFPNCRRVCNLAHTHSILDPDSVCGCCPAHRSPQQFARAPSSSGTQAPKPDADGPTAAPFQVGVPPSSSRTLRKLHEIKASREVAMAKTGRRVHTKRQQPAFPFSGSPQVPQEGAAVVKSTKTATIRATIAKGGVSHMLLAGFVPSAEDTGAKSVSRDASPTRERASTQPKAARPVSAPPTKATI